MKKYLIAVVIVLLGVGLWAYSAHATTATIGYTTIGGTAQNTSNIDITCNGDAYTPAQDGTAASMSIYGSGTANVQMALYTSSGAFVANTASVAMNGTPQFFTGTLSSVSLSSSSSYVLCWQLSATANVYYDNNSTLTTTLKVNTFGAWPSTITLNNSAENRQFSEYLTYTISTPIHSSVTLKSGTWVIKNSTVIIN